MHKIVSFSASTLLWVICAFFLSTCAKEYSYEGGPINGGGTGTAVYTLSGAGGTCTGSILSGNYYETAPLTAGNTVQLQVHVTTIGTYSVTTGTANGIRFAGSGNFVDTGFQTITLLGSGTPVAAGNYTYTTPVGAGCSFDVPVTRATKPLANFTLDGAPNDCQNPTVSGDYISGTSLKTSNTVTLNVTVTLAGPYSVSTDTLDGIYFAASGDFTTTGANTITLIGNGTPEFARNLTFTPLSAGSHCTFNLTVVNPQPLATYVLESGYGSPSPCIYTVSGNYQAGDVLTTANTVSMHVFVTYVGNFTIATNTMNGMQFSYSGSFTTTGAQSVILTASGKPIAAEKSSFIPMIVGPHPLGGEACGFDVTVQ